MTLARTDEVENLLLLTSFFISHPLASQYWLSSLTHARRILGGEILTAKILNLELEKWLEVITVRILSVRNPERETQCELRQAKFT